MSLSVAPMIGWTDRNYRFLMRQITRETVLYTEMIMDQVLLHNPGPSLEQYLGYNRQVEPPLVLQLGGNNPETLSEAVTIAEQFGGFAEINLNNGCPSGKAKKAGFGAELMLDPELVRKILHGMKRRSSCTEVTVKCRIGIQNKKESWSDLVTYIEACRAAGCRKVIVHARVCVLSGLTPAQNRTIPPLRYDVVYRLVDEFPDMQFVLNGGVKSLDEVTDHMIGNGISYQHRHNQDNCDDILPNECQNESMINLEQLSQAVEPSVTTQYTPVWSLSLSNRFGKKIASTAVASFEKVISHGYQYCTQPSLLSKQLNIGSRACSSYTTIVDGLSSNITGSDETMAVCLRGGGGCLAGVMIGREAYNNPWSLADADRYFFNKANPGHSRREVLESYLDHTRYAQDNDHAKSSAAVLCKPLHNFFYGCPTNKQFKQKFDELIKSKIEKRQGKTSKKRKVRWQ